MKFAILLLFEATSLVHTLNTIMEVANKERAAGSKKDVQTTEIEEIKQTYPGQVRVISGVGEFANVVTVHPEGQDLHCKFQLPENYPDSLPTISVRSSVLTAEQTAELTSHLQNLATSRQNHMMLEVLMASCRKWLQDNGIDLSAKAVNEKSKDKKRKGKSKCGKTSEKVTSENREDDSCLKKPPMKTAADVIKRLQWDTAFNKEDFVVGYLDRIKGLLEKNFTAFTWEDLASVDLYSLAIPQHRIQYFKYKTEKVWDKNERLDNVFGSTGSKITLVEAVQKYDEKQRELENDNIGGGENLASGSQGAEGACIKKLEEEKVCATVEPKAPEDETKSQTVKSQQQSKASASPKFNHFVALQITDKAVIQNVGAMQERFLAKYPQFKDSRYPINGLHLTLAVFRIDTDDERRTCVEVMKGAAKDFEQMAKVTRPLSFQGLDSFSTKVIFARVIVSREFLDLVDTIRHRLSKAGFKVESFAFKPHLTLFKVPHSVYISSKWQKGGLVLTPFKETDFGSQPVNNIQVCRMGTLPEEEGAGGFYENIFKMDIENNAQQDLWDWEN